VIRGCAIIVNGVFGGCKMDRSIIAAIIVGASIICTGYVVSDALIKSEEVKRFSLLELSGHATLLDSKSGDMFVLVAAGKGKTPAKSMRINLLEAYDWKQELSDVEKEITAEMGKAERSAADDNAAK
jgi:hypothetical protein